MRHAILDPIGLVMRFVKEVAEERPPDRRLEIHPDMMLLDADSKLDSLELVTIAAGLEEALQRQLGIEIDLSEVAATRPEHFRTPNTLAGWLATLHEDRGA